MSKRIKVADLPEFDAAHYLDSETSSVAYLTDIFGSYYFFYWQVSALNDRFEHLEQMLVTPPPAAADTHTPTPQAGKKHGQH